MTSKDERKTIVLEAESGHFSVTGNDAKFEITAAEVATLTSSANTKFEELATEMSKRIEEIANTVSGSE